MDERAKKDIKTIRSRVSARARPDIQFDKHCDGSKPAGHAFEPVCWLRSVSSTQANCPSPEPSKPTHSLKNRGASERERPKPSDLPVALAAQIVQPETILRWHRAWFHGVLAQEIAEEGRATKDRS